jgi:hypothetical protein
MPQEFTRTIICLKYPTLAEYFVTEDFSVARLQGAKSATRNFRFASSAQI